MRDFSKRALDLILRHEGMDHGGWPGGESGLTIGRGYDLGYVTREQFDADWKDRLPKAVYFLLRECIGLKEWSAQQRAKALRGKITIPTAAADAVFFTATLPKYTELARQTFGESFDSLPLDAQGALVSLVFNRGPALRGKNRQGMKAIFDILADGVQSGDLQKIAVQLREMKAIWKDKGLDGLIRRREEEAQLVETAEEPCASSR